MLQLGIYENTSKIQTNNTNKGNKSRSLNKIEANKLTNLLTYMYYRINNAHDKNDSSNDHGESYCFKETQLGVYMFDTIFKDI